MADGEDDLMFFIDFHCTSNFKHSLGRKAIHFNSCSPPKTIKDIKTKIEETHSVPGIVTRLQLNCVVLHDEDSLDGLNLRRGDTFSVQYYSKVDRSEVSRLIQWMEELLGLLEKWRDDNESVDIEKEIKGESCLDDLTDTCFYPWMTPEKDANKYYFIWKGGVSLVTRIVDILLDHPPASLPRKLLALESKILCILWDISMDEHIVRAIVHGGGVETCFRGLMRMESAELIDDESTTVWDDMYYLAVEETMLRSLGVLANLCEPEEFRLTIASNKEAIKQMLSISSSPFFDRSVIHRVIMIFLHLSYTHTTHEYLITNDKFSSMVNMPWLEYDDETNFIMKFHYSVLFSNLLLVSSQYFNPCDVEFLRYTLGIVAAKANPIVIATIEESRVRYWSTLAPLVIALYQHCSNTAPDFISPCKLTILVALLSMLRREYHCKVLVKEGMVDFCICLPWYTQGDVQTRAVKLVSMIKKSPDIVYQAPSLLNMCKAAVAVHYDCGLSCVINSTVPELAGKLRINN